MEKGSLSSPKSISSFHFFWKDKKSSQNQSISGEKKSSSFIFPEFPEMEDMSDEQFADIISPFPNELCITTIKYWQNLVIYRAGFHGMWILDHKNVPKKLSRKILKNEGMEEMNTLRLFPN